MTTDPLRELQNAGTDAYAARLDGHTLLASGSYIDAAVPVLALELNGEEPLDVAGSAVDGAFTFRLEVWTSPDGDAVVVATDTGDEPDTLISDAHGMVDDIEALLRQATGAPLRVSAIYLLEYEGHPILVWEAAP